MLMPWWMKIYTVLFIIIIISNLAFQFKLKGKKIVMVYEFFSAVYMVFLIVAYWSPSMIIDFNPYYLTALPFILGVDFYLTLWGKEEELGIKMPEMSHKEFETAKVISIVFAAPAYITGLLLACHILLNKPVFYPI